MFTLKYYFSGYIYHFSSWSKLVNMQLSSASGYYIISKKYQIQSSSYVGITRKTISLRNNWEFWESDQDPTNSVRNVPEVRQFIFMYTKSILISVNIFISLFSPLINALVVNKASFFYFYFHSNFLSLHFLLTRFLLIWLVTVKLW